MKNSILAILFLGMASCAHIEKKVDESATTKQSILSEIEAKNRSQFISSVDYDLDLDLSKGDDNYEGRMVIQFMTAAARRDLRIDFSDGDIKDIVLNGKPLDVIYNKHSLFIPGSFIEKGAQRLEIHFTQSFSHEGRGLSLFRDPIDKLTYVSTDFEPYDANRAFPCFDQPDLKATFSMKVLVPKSWEVISTTRETDITEVGSFKRWVFARTPRISTYVFSLHGGPFTKWEDKNFRYPLRLFARRSLAKYVVADEWFPISRHGFDFFEKYFATPYPYKKYDQIIVPEFNAGAMENVAAVTFTERMISRGSKTRNQLRNLANTILHEMAHMWFGDLVTMKWWGDLWLNESFATYMASLALANSSQYPEAWHQFFAGKAGAYYEDQMVTTHPIIAKINNTSEAFSNFDSITYGKGASVIKQLSYRLGEKQFQAGLKIYFDRFAEHNTDFKDFLNSMSEASGQNLDSWQKLWLETAGLNSIGAQFECRDEKISQFALIQTAPSGVSVIRPHTLEIAFLSRANQRVSIDSTLKVEMDQPTVYVAEAIGKPCPHAVYPNYKDYDYAKVRLDDRTANNLKTSLNEVEDDLLRHQLWYGLWDKVRDAEFSFVAYGDLIVPEAIAKEKNDLILRMLTGNLASVLYYYDLTPSLKETAKSEFATNLDREIWQRLKLAKPKSNDQLIWADSLASLMTSPAGLEHVKALLANKESIRDFKLDQDRRWDLVATLARQNVDSAKQLIEAEAIRDPSATGVERKISAQASLPIWDEKMKWISEYKNEHSIFSFSQFRSAIYSLFPRNQYQLRANYADQFFKDMTLINASKENFQASAFAGLAPLECTSAEAGKIQSYLNSTPNLQPLVTKILKMTAQEGERCRKIVELAEKGGRFSSP